MRVGKVGLCYLECVFGRQDCSTWNACSEDTICFTWKACSEGRIVPLGMRVGNVELLYLQCVLGR